MKFNRTEQSIWHGLQLVIALAILACGQVLAGQTLSVPLRSRVAIPDARGQFRVSYELQEWDPSDTAIIICDKSARILYMNRFYAGLLGVDKEEAVGRHIMDFFPTSRVPSVIDSGRVEMGARCTLRAAIDLVVNRIPIKSDGGNRRGHAADRIPELHRSERAHEAAQQPGKTSGPL